MTRLTDIETRMHEIDQERYALGDEARALRHEHDAIRLEARPTYPTKIHQAGIRKARRYFINRIAPQSHPYSKVRIGEKLWGFTDEEIEEMLRLVREQGFTIAEWWRHDGGISIVVVLPPGRNSDTLPVTTTESPTLTVGALEVKTKSPSDVASSASGDGSWR